MDALVLPEVAQVLFGNGRVQRRCAGLEILITRQDSDRRILRTSWAVIDATELMIATQQQVVAEVLDLVFR